MAIPTYDELMLPVLRHCAEKTWVMRDLVAQIADDLQLKCPSTDFVSHLNRLAGGGWRA
jgi:hypothetical protein